MHLPVALSHRPSAEDLPLYMISRCSRRSRGQARSLSVFLDYGKSISVKAVVSLLYKLTFQSISQIMSLLLTESLGFVLANLMNFRDSTLLFKASVRWYLLPSTLARGK